MPNKIKLAIYSLLIISGFLIYSSSAEAAVDVYYSVGQNTSNHETGAGTVTVDGAIRTATFSVSQTASNMGVGDIIDYDSDNKRCYISSKISETQWTCTNATGGAPTAASGVAVNSISHAFQYLSVALPSGAGGIKTLLGNSDLTALDVVLNIACYYDSGADPNAVMIDGWTTDATRYIRIYTPNNIETEVNQSQRHDGTAGTGYFLQLDNENRIYEDYVRIDGLELYNSLNNDVAFLFPLSGGVNSDIRISNCLLHGFTNVFYMQGYLANYRLWNNVLYNNTGYGFYADTGAASLASFFYIYNNTIIGGTRGINVYGGTRYFYNNIVQNTSQANYNVGTPTASGNNISEDSTSPNSGATDCGGHSCRSQSITFIDEDNNDFRLALTDTVAKDAGTNLSSDSNLSFTTDIDGDSRTVGTWDIGADEYTENGAFTVSGWVRMTGTSVATKVIVAKAEELRLVTDGSGNPACQIKSGGTWQTAAVSSSALTLNEWAHVACAYNKSTLKVYINGVQKDSDSLSAGVDNTSASLKFGVDDSADGTYGDFQGFLDEVRMYPYARSATQIQFDYNVGLAGLSAKRGASVTMGNESEKWMSEGLVGYWRMDESSWNGTASEVLDASGNGNNGTSAAGATTDVGKFGKGGSFDGVDDYVNAGSGSSLDNLASFTWSTWVKVTGNPENNRGMVLFKGSGSSLQRRFSFLPTTGSDEGRVSAFIETDGTDAYSVSTTLTYEPNVWQFWTVTYNNSGDRRLHIYKNGQEVSYQSQNNTSGTMQNDSSYNLYIGNDNNSFYTFNGIIDEARIYNRILSPDEINSLYQWGPQPITHIRMDEKISGDAQTLYDSSGYQRNAATEQGSNATGMDCTQRGKYGSSCDLDGTDDYMQINDFDY